MTATLTRPDPATTPTPDDVVHLVCQCDHDIALCGEPVIDQPWIDPTDTDLPPCRACTQLVNVPCGQCGFDPGHDRP